MSVSPWFKCYPDQFILGMENLDTDEQAFYNQIVMRMYHAGDAIYVDDRTIARWCNSNARKWNRVRQSLLDKGRIVEVPGGGIVDERALEEMHTYCRESSAKVPERVRERIAKLYALFAKDTEKNCETASENPIKSVPLLEERKKKELPPDGALALDRLRAVIGEGGSLRTELDRLEDAVAGWCSEHDAFVVSSKFSRNHFQEKLRAPLRDLGLSITCP